MSAIGIAVANTLYGVGDRPGCHEDDRREPTRRKAEPRFQQRVGRHQLAVVVARQQRVGDDDAAQDVSGNDLEESKIADVGQPRDADEREGAGFAGDHGEQHAPPRNVLVSDEIVPRVALPAPQVEA